MKQILQSLTDGKVELVEVPLPAVKANHLLVRTRVTLISAGTERTLLEFGKASFVDKARQQPDKVRMVMDKVKTDGLLPTIDSVRNKLETPLPLGYCNVGTVLEVGKGVEGFEKGDRIVSNGPHAEIVSVPSRLCVRLPDEVSDEAGVFTVLGAVGLEGIRLIAPSCGETIVVTGMGIIGLLAAQLLRASGCRVLGIDTDSARLALARESGIETVDLSRGEDPISAAQRISRGRGVDGVLITASTSSSEPIHQAAEMCRTRGRIVLVGSTGMEFSRADFYAKELTFQVSCSYGPGRYDSAYEELGQDYPVGFVRWTAQRNFEAVTDLLRDGRLDPAKFVSHKFPFDRAPEAYDVITGKERSLGVLLQYPASCEMARKVAVPRPESEPAKGGHLPVVGAIGAGNFATQGLFPGLKQTGATLHTVVSQGGLSGFLSARRHGFEFASTEYKDLLDNPAINAIVIATRHDTHADMVIKALEAGKHVFVEKPLAISESQLHRIEVAYSLAKAKFPQLVLMIGFNRRFSPHVMKCKSLLAGVSGPKALIFTCNAGMVPANHWAMKMDVGGGRIIGEACHFIDLLRFLVGKEISKVEASRLPGAEGADKSTIQLSFADGSIGSVHYLANGHKSFPKERLEIFANGGILQLNNFKKLVGFGWKGFRGMKTWRQDKGHRAGVAAFIEAIRKGEPSPIPFAEIVEVTRASFEASGPELRAPKPEAGVAGVLQPLPA